MYMLIFFESQISQHPKRVQKSNGIYLLKAEVPLLMISNFWDDLEELSHMRMGEDVEMQDREEKKATKD